MMCQIASKIKLRISIQKPKVLSETQSFNRKIVFENYHIGKSMRPTWTE